MVCRDSRGDRGLTALLLAVWVSSRISRPLAALAEKTAVLDLDRLDVDFDAGTDEVGRLSRLLGDLRARLRTSTARVREAERRATVGELARQINHDIKNGLIPLRNVMRHLAQVERDEPGALPVVFAERRQTIDSSIAYLETLATSYQRLSRPPNRRDCDLNALITDVVRAAQGTSMSSSATDLTDLPPVVGDPVAFRRILENLIANAVDSLQSKPGRITVSTQVVTRERTSRRRSRVTVADTGRGMSADEAGPDLRRLLYDEGGRHRSGALHRSTTGDGPPRHDRRRERAWQRERASSSTFRRDAHMTTQVLVVDDVPAMAEQYAYDLKRVGGYHTIVAAGGDEALDVLARSRSIASSSISRCREPTGFEVLRGCSSAASTRRSSSTPAPAATTAASRRCGSAPTGSSTRRSRSSASFRRSRTPFRAGGWSRRFDRCGPPRR